ncbi:MAG: hypothetical protein IT364_11080 [Candidatus Hydrogenedentes bacterium]|nr:hypothetical protein [Candidatus Hydrogenedentota bacterium]
MKPRFTSNTAALLILACALLALPSGMASDAAAPAQGDVKPFLKSPFLLGAHRGGSDVWPENTLDAFREAANRFPGILLETDARLTVDGAIVLMHDGTVDRTTDGTGAISGLTFEQIRALDAGYRFSLDGGQTFPYRGKGLKVPTLEELLTALPDARLLVEFKGGAELAEAGIAAIRKANAIDRVLIASFKPETMARVRGIAPEIATCFDFADGVALLNALRANAWDSYTPTSEVLSLDEGMLPQFKLTPTDLQAIRSKGIRIQLHTINERARILEVLGWGVDSILSDKPDILAEAIAEWQAKQHSAE